MSEKPFAVIWEGDCFKPASSYWQHKADEEFVIGQRYNMALFQERSQASHNRYFAAIEEAWKNLPHQLSERFPTSEHLRKYALIKAGWCNTQVEVFATRKDAERAAALIIPRDEFSIVDVRETTVTVYAAKSQRKRAMDKKEFQASSDAVLEFVAGLIGTSQQTLQENVGKAA